MNATRRSLILLGVLLAACETTRSGLADCPNWFAAERKAGIIAACDASHHGDPKSRCQMALKRCRGGCDICQFLGTAKRLDAYVADKAEWGPIRRVAMSDRAPNGYDGMRATEEVGAFRRQYKFNWYLCNEFDQIDVLAETITHEAMHQCFEVTPPGILDKKFAPPIECSAQALENICVGK